MFRYTTVFLIPFIFLIFPIVEINAALQRGDIIYRTSKKGYMYGYTDTVYAYFRPDRPGHTGIYVGDGYVVEAKWEGLFSGNVENNLLSKFVDSSEGQIYVGAKTTIDEPDSNRRENIVQIALDHVGEGYDNNFLDQKGPGNNQWTCVGLTEKAYESADTPNVLQYAKCSDGTTGTNTCYGTGTTNYALDITPDGIDKNLFFSAAKEMSSVTGDIHIFFPYTQYLQTTLKNVITDLPVSDNFHTLTAPSKTTVSQGGLFGTIRAKQSNNSSFYYKFNVQPYVTKPDGTNVNFEQISTGLSAGKTITPSLSFRIPASSELGQFTFGVKITDTNGNLIDDDSFEFTVVSGSSYASKRSNRRLKRLMRNPETQVVEEEGWKVVIVPERNR